MVELLLQCGLKRRHMCMHARERSCEGLRSQVRNLPRRAWGFTSDPQRLAVCAQAFAGLGGDCLEAGEVIEAGVGRCLAANCLWPWGMYMQPC